MLGLDSSPCYAAVLTLPEAARMDAILATAATAASLHAHTAQTRHQAGTAYP